MNLDQLAREAGADLRRHITTIDPPAPDAIARRSRRGRIASGLAALTVLVLAGAGLTLTLRQDTEPDRLQITDDPAPTSTLPANGWVASFNGTVLERYGGTSGPKEVLDGTGTQACPAFSPDGERLMFGREDALGRDTLAVFRVTEEGLVVAQSTIPIDGIEDDRYDIPCASWAPDGRWAAFGGGGNVWVVDTETAEVRQLPIHDATDLEWRPGTDQLAVTGRSTPGDVGGNNPINLYTVSTGEIDTVDGVEAAEFTWSPDGATIAYTEAVPDGGDTRSGITLVDADGTNRRTLTTDDWVEQAIGPVWSPSGDTIAYQRERADCAEATCYERSEVVLVTVTDDDPADPLGTERTVPALPDDLYGEAGLVPSPYYVNGVTWSPDGTQLLYTGSVGLVRVPVDTDQRPTVLSNDPLTNLYADDTTKPWLALQAWQPVR